MAIDRDAIAIDRDAIAMDCHSGFEIEGLYVSWVFLNILWLAQKSMNIYSPRKSSKQYVLLSVNDYIGIQFNS